MQSLQIALNHKHKDDINALHHEFDGMAILHRLVTSRYANQTELVTTLMTFSNADINLTTRNGKTAFHLAVEVLYTVYRVTPVCCSKLPCVCSVTSANILYMYNIHNSGMIVITL